MTTIAVIAAALLVGMAALQVGLALGAPLGAYVWGGAHQGRLPPKLRIGSAAAVVLLIFMALVLLAKGGVLDWSPVPWGWLGSATWMIAGFMVLNTVGNLASKTEFERFVFGSVTALLAVLAAMIAR